MATITERWRPAGAAVALALLATLPGGARAQGVERAYSGEAGLVRVDRRNANFDTRLPIVGRPPAPGARILSVSYRWHYDNPPAGFSMALCQEGGRCSDVSDASARQTLAFVGEDPARPFYFRARVSGQGNLLPLGGGPAQIIVVWRE
ncbi:MAG: flagellar protein FlhE [Candidatus Dactylopiibacterium sp.]|nr:flagellar protein FlhE [Candidatus Dactylopiibacterium sp.]